MTTVEDRLASTETALSCALDTIRKLSHRLDQLEDRISQTPAQDSPAAQRERAHWDEKIRQTQQADRERRAAQEAARRQGAAEHYLALMSRVEQDPHIHAMKSRLDHLETARPYGISETEWAREKPHTPADGCCSGCCRSPFHDHSVGYSFASKPRDLKARWNQIRIHYQQEAA